MNSAQLHLMLTHIPVLGTAFALFLVLLASFTHSDDVRRAAILVFALAGLSSVPAYLTGNAASTLLAKLHSDVTDQHAEVAIIALTAALFLSLLSSAGLFFFRKRKTLPRWFVALMFVSGTLVFGAMAWTANLGGKIRHSEIHQTARS